MNSATDLYRRASQADDRENLIIGNIDYVRKILSTMTVAVRNEDDKENLESAGLVGLVQAAHSFDATRGVAFQTFAYPRIRGAIVDELRKLSPVSQAVLQQIGQIKKAYQLLEPPVTPEALSKHTGLTLEQVETCLEAMRFLKPQDWNDFHCTIHGSWKTQPGTPEYELERSELKQLLSDSIQLLPEKERLVVTLYYAEDLTLSEIGEVVGNSESRVSRILSAAKFRLKEIVRRHTS